MFKVNRKQLADELSLLQSVLEIRTTMSILAYVKIEAENDMAQLTASKIDATMKVELPVEGDAESYCLPLAQLRDAVKLFDGEPVRFQRADNRVEVSCGRSRHKFPCREASEFPQSRAAQGETLALNARTLLDAVERVAPCVDRRAGKYATQGICFDASEGVLHLVAFDGVQAGIVKIAETDAQFQVVVPDVALAALRAVLTDAESATLTVNPDVAEIATGNRSLMARLLSGEFPRWRQVVPTGINHRLTLNKDVLAAIKRCCVTASEGNLVRRRLKLEFGRETLTVRSYGGDGESIEDVPVACSTLNGEPLTVKVNADQMIAFLESVEAPELSIKDATSILLLQEGEHRYLHATLRPDA